MNTTIDLSKYIVERTSDNNIILTPFDINNYNIKEVDGKLILSLIYPEIELIDIPKNDSPDDKYFLFYLQDILKANYNQKLNYLSRRIDIIYNINMDGTLKNIIKDINNRSDYYDKMIESCKKRYYLEHVARFQDAKIKELNKMVDNMIIVNEQLYYSLKFNL
jgi:hypothetical protein